MAGISEYHQAREWKRATGGKVIGHFLADVPEELITAAGLLPMAVLGGSKETALAGGYLQPFACSLASSGLELALSGELDFLDGIVIPNICDTTKTLGGIWQELISGCRVFNFSLPRQPKGPSSRDYLRSQVERLKAELEVFTGQEITPSDLVKSIEVHNQNRSLLRRLFNGYRQNPEVVPLSDVYTAVRSSMVRSKEESIMDLRRLLRRYEAGAAAPGSGRRPRLILWGVVPAPPGILEMIHESGGVVVGDNLCVGWRYAASDVPLGQPEGIRGEVDPIEALVQRQIDRGYFCCFHEADPKDTTRPLLELIREARGVYGSVDGVVFLHLKFCDPEDYSYPVLRDELDRLGIPHLLIESDLGGSQGQIKTRLEAFFEQLGG